MNVLSDGVSGIESVLPTAVICNTDGSVSLKRPGRSRMDAERGYFAIYLASWVHRPRAPPLPSVDHVHTPFLSNVAGDVCSV